MVVVGRGVPRKEKKTKGEKKKNESSLHLNQCPGMKKTEMMMLIDVLMIQL